MVCGGSECESTRASAPCLPTLFSISTECVCVCVPYVKSIINDSQFKKIDPRQARRRAGVRDLLAAGPGEPAGGPLVPRGVWGLLPRLGLGGGGGCMGRFSDVGNRASWRPSCVCRCMCLRWTGRGEVGACVVVSDFVGGVSVGRMGVFVCVCIYIYIPIYIYIYIYTYICSPPPSTRTHTTTGRGAPPPRRRRIGRFPLRPRIRPTSTSILLIIRRRLVARGAGLPAFAPAGPRDGRLLHRAVRAVSMKGIARGLYIERGMDGVKGLSLRNDMRPCLFCECEKKEPTKSWKRRKSIQIRPSLLIVWCAPSLLGELIKTSMLLSDPESPDRVGLGGFAVFALLSLCCACCRSNFAPASACPVSNQRAHRLHRQLIQVKKNQFGPSNLKSAETDFRKIPLRRSIGESNRF